MKGEYVEPTQHRPFSKLHPFSPHSPQLIPREPDPETQTPTQTQTKPTEPASDEATIEVIRRPRGRPPGSRNKPKPPVIITREPTQPIMSPYILEILPGNDLVDTIYRFSRHRNLGICVLTGSGAVSNVTLRQPSTSPVGSTITFHGRFDILSISATFLPTQPGSSLSFHVPTNFTISLAGPQGQIVGGIVAGGLLAAGTVYVVAASFNNPSYHRLPGELEEGRNVNNNNNNNNNNNSSVSGSGGGGGGGEGQSPGVSVSGSRGGKSGDGSGDQQGGMYSCHIGGGPDVIWAPTARPPPPPY